MKRQNKGATQVKPALAEIWKPQSRVCRKRGVPKSAVDNFGVAFQNYNVHSFCSNSITSEWVILWVSWQMCRKTLMTRLFNAAFFKIAKGWKQPKGPSKEYWLNQQWYMTDSNAVIKKKRMSMLGTSQQLLGMAAPGVVQCTTWATIWGILGKLFTYW